MRLEPGLSPQGSKLLDRLARIEVAADCLGIPHVQGFKMDVPWGIATCVEGVPQGSVLCRIYLDNTTRDQTVGLVYAHESFGRLCEGAMIPIIPVLLRFERKEPMDDTAD